MSNRNPIKTKQSARNDEAKGQLRATILEAARKIALEEGFAQLSIRKLADAIGYVPGNIYLYFRNRDEIIREICLSGFAPLYAELKAAVACAPAAERLSVLLHTYADFALKHPQTYRLSFMEDPKFAEEMFRAAPLEGEEGAGQRAFALVVDEVRTLKKAGKVAADADEILLAEVLWTGIHGVVSMKLLYPAFPTSPTTALVDKMVQTLFKGCYRD